MSPRSPKALLPASPRAHHIDRAAIITVAIQQIAGGKLESHELAQIADQLRDELAELSRQMAADRGDLPLCVEGDDA